MTVPTKLSVLIIDPDVGSRSRLKQAAMAVKEFGEVAAVSRIEESRIGIYGGKEWRVVFISSKLERREIADIIYEGKRRSESQDSAFVMVMKAKDQDSVNVAANVMIGADGFLLEPYSLDALVEITELAGRVKNERSLAREKAAFDFVSKDIGREIDQLAYMLYSNINIQPRLAKLKERCSVLKSLPSSSLEIFVESVVDTFEEANLPVAQLRRENAYNGASQAVRRKIAKRFEEQPDRSYGMLLMKKNV